MLQLQCCVNSGELQRAYQEMLQSAQIGVMFKHSSYTAMPIGITGSLLKIRKQLENNDDDEILLKAASLEIIRFVSILADMYTNKAFKDKNKSVASVLSQQGLNMQFSDILVEMRHSLTHKAIPDKKLIIASINYILDYLSQNYWQPKLHQPSPLLEQRIKLKQKLDALVEEEEFVLNEDINNRDNHNNTIVFALDYIVGLADYHVIEKSNMQRLKDRRVGDQRISIVCKYVLDMIIKLFNNKWIRKQKLQLNRRKRLMECINFIKLYRKLKFISMMKPKVNDFIMNLEKELPELLNHQIDLENDEIHPINKKQCIGQIYNQFTQLN